MTIPRFMKIAVVVLSIYAAIYIFIAATGIMIVV
jgi:hypothetical protein